MNQRPASIALFLVALAGPSGPIDAGTQGASGMVGDPDEDTFGSGAVQHDVTSFSARYTDSELILTVTFNGTISPGNSNQANAVVAAFDVDTDQDPKTGLVDGFLEPFCPSAGSLGVDYLVLVGFGNTAGESVPVQVLDLSQFSPTQLEPPPALEAGTVTHASKSFTARVPLEVLGNDDGLADLRVGVGTVPEPTDCAPNGDFLTTSSSFFLRGDCNGDGEVAGSVSDAVYIILLGRDVTASPEPPCLAACDADGDGNVAAVTDAVYILQFNFLNGPPLPDPFPTCGFGLQPRDGALGCEGSPAGCR